MLIFLKVILTWSAFKKPCGTLHFHNIWAKGLPAPGWSRGGRHSPMPSVGRFFGGKLSSASVRSPSSSSGGGLLSTSPGAGSGSSGHSHGPTPSSGSTRPPGPAGPPKPSGRAGLGSFCRWRRASRPSSSGGWQWSRITVARRPRVMARPRQPSSVCCRHFQYTLSPTAFSCLYRKDSSTRRRPPNGVLRNSRGLGAAEGKERAELADVEQTCGQGHKRERWGWTQMRIVTSA